MSINPAKIEQDIKLLIDNPIDKSSFIYDFLLAFGTAKSNVVRLKTTSINKAEGEGNVEWKNKLIFYQVEDNEELVDKFNRLRLEYSNSKLNPRFIILTDFKTLYSYDTKHDDTLNIEFKDLTFNVDFFFPLAGIEKFEAPEEAKADVKAADKMAKLFELLSFDNPLNTNEEVHNLNIFLTRLLFCFFAEDTNLFDNKLFTNSVSAFTNKDGSDTDIYIQRLFAQLNVAPNKSGESIDLRKFPYVNGGLFRENYPIPKFSARSRQQLLNCGQLDWSEINPDIFGSMIQAVVKTEKRGLLGMHYTSVPNIMKVIKPLFLDALYEEYEKCIEKDYKEKKKGLNFLLLRLERIKIFDPACGSGNFLIIAYKELRKLEMKIIKELDLITFSQITLNQFYGIEIDDFAHETALLSLWLAEHQMDLLFAKELGQFKSPLPLKESGNIVCGNATRLNWKEICPNDNNEEVYVLGNPPYLGSSMQDEKQKEDIAFVFNGIDNYKNLDYISCWFYLGAKYIQGTKSKYSFVSTNSICQGEQVSLLWSNILNDNLEIYFAYNNFKWTNNAKSQAAVICVIIGLRNKDKQPKYLFYNDIKNTVPNINAYLINANDTLINRINYSISRFKDMIRGSMPSDGGHLIISKTTKDDLIDKYNIIKPFIKKYIGSAEFIRSQERYCLWIDNEEDYYILKAIPEIDNIFQKVSEFRNSSDTITTQEWSNKPYSFRQPQYKKSNSIIIPIHSSENRDYIPIGFCDEDTVISNAAMAIYDAELWLFGVLTSRMHMVWVRAVAGRLKTDYRYSAQLCYNTFPFPNITNQQKEMIVDFVDRVMEERYKEQTKTLAELYDPDKMPEGLREAHHELDLYIDSIYRQKPFESDEERLSHLFTMYERITKKK